MVCFSSILAWRCSLLIEIFSKHSQNNFQLILEPSVIMNAERIALFPIFPLEVYLSSSLNYIYLCLEDDRIFSEVLERLSLHLFFIRFETIPIPFRGICFWAVDGGCSSLFCLVA